MSASKKGAESIQTEPASASTSKKGAKPKSVAPASTSGDSKVSSRGPGSVQTEPAKRLAKETMEYLLTLHGELFSCPKEWELKNRIIMLNKGYLTREQTRTAAISQNREIKQVEMGYSWSKMHLRQRRAVEDQSDMLDFNKLLQKSQDDDTYDSEADNEAEKLESAIDREKHSQATWKEERWKVTEAHEQRTIVSQWERMEKFMQLAMQLSYSEKNQWHDQFRGNDRAQKECTDSWYIHYFVHNHGLMQEGQDALYSLRMQSKVKRFKQELPDTKWLDWESTSEYDTDIDAEVENLTNKLQTRVDELRALQEQQLMEEETVQLVTWMVQPVVSTMPDPPVVDMHTTVAEAEPETTMGPGQPAKTTEMPTIFTETGDEQKEREQHEEDEAERAAQFHGHFRHDTEAVDEGDFDNDAEL